MTTIVITGMKNEDLERGGDLADHRDAAHVDPGKNRNQRDRDQVVLHHVICGK